MKKIKSIVMTVIMLIGGFYASAQVQPKDTMAKPKMDTVHRKPTTPPKPSTKPTKPTDTMYRAPKPGQVPPKK